MASASGNPLPPNEPNDGSSGSGHRGRKRRIGGEAMDNKSQRRDNPPNPAPEQQRPQQEANNLTNEVAGPSNDIFNESEVECIEALVRLGDANIHQEDEEEDMMLLLGAIARQGVRLDGLMRERHPPQDGVGSSSSTARNTNLDKK